MANNGYSCLVEKAVNRLEFRVGRMRKEKHGYSNLEIIGMGIVSNRG
jgi:hypothetical protein